MLKTVNLAVALVITVASLCLGFRFMMTGGPLWRDEAATLQFATQPTYGDVVRSLDLVSLPPLYPTIVRAWSWGGWKNEDLAARGLGLLVTAAVLAAIWLGARAVDMHPPLITLALFATHGTVLSTIGLVRPYGLGALAVVAASCAMVTFVTAPRALTFVAATAGATLAVQTQYQNTLLVAVVCAGGVIASAWVRDWKRAALVVAAGAVAAVSLAPYLPILERSQKWRILHRTMSENDLRFLVVRFADLLSMKSDIVLVLWFVLILIAGYGTMRALTEPSGSPLERQRLTYGATALLGGVGLFLVFFDRVDRFLQPWHVVPVIALMALSLDMIFAQSAWPRPTRVVAAVLAAAVSLPLAIPFTTVRQTNIDLYAQRLERDARAGDLILVNPWFMGITFHRYYHGPVNVMTIPPVDDLRIYRFDEIRERMVAREPLAPVEAAIMDTLRGGHRVFVVGGLPLESGLRPEPMPPAPHPVTGWSESPYTIGWALEIGYFLQAHGRKAYRLAIPTRVPVNGYEAATLLMVEGWLE